MARYHPPIARTRLRIGYLGNAMLCICSYGSEPCPPDPGGRRRPVVLPKRGKAYCEHKKISSSAPQVISHRAAGVILAEHAAPLQFGHDHTPELLEHAREYRRRNDEAVAATRLE